MYSDGADIEISISSITSDSLSDGILRILVDDDDGETPDVKAFIKIDTINVGTYTKVYLSGSGTSCDLSVEVENIVSANLFAVSNYHSLATLSPTCSVSTLIKKTSSYTSLSCYGGIGAFKVESANITPSGINTIGFGGQYDADSIINIKFQGNVNMDGITNGYGVMLDTESGTATHVFADLNVVVQGSGYDRSLFVWKEPSFMTITGNVYGEKGIEINSFGNAVDASRLKVVTDDTVSIYDVSASASHILIEGFKSNKATGTLSASIGTAFINSSIT